MKFRPGRNKAMAEIIAERQSLGWVVTRTGGGHLKFVPPWKDGKVIYTAATPSDARALKNIEAEFHRCEIERIKQCPE